MTRPLTHLPTFLLLLALSTLPAYAQFNPTQYPNQNLPRVRGIVASIAPNHRCFTLTDRNGNSLTVPIDANTQYIFGRDTGSPIDVLQPGEDVSAHLLPSGTAADVTNRNRANRPPAAELKQLLDLSDDDCLVIIPALAKVQSLQQALTGQLRGSPIDNARSALRDALRNPATPDSQLTPLLQSLRTARTTTQRQLTKARENLISLLTPRQEATLIQQGLLE